MTTTVTNSSAPTRPTQTGARIEFSAIRKDFGATNVLQGFELTLEPGEFVALLGPSGCGKTTALRVLAGFETATSGTLTMDGRDILSVPAHRRGIGMVFQSYSLFPNLTVGGNVSFGLSVRKQSRSTQKTKVKELLDLVGLAGYADRYPTELSGGQQQRVALARALAIEPRVLLLDEPLSALDAKVRSTLRDEIRELQLRLGITVLFVTHDQEEALALADRVAVMRDGTIEQIDSPPGLYDHPHNDFVARFVGTTNQLVVKRGEPVPDLWTPARTGDRDVLYVRPERLAFEPSEDGYARVVSHMYQGARAVVTARLEDPDLVVHGASDLKVDVPATLIGELPVGLKVRLRITGRPALRLEA